MIDKKKLVHKCLQILLSKEHQVPAIRGLIADSDMETEGNMICVYPWPKGHALLKIADSVQVPTHVYLRDIIGIMEIENGEKASNDTAGSNLAGSESNKEDIKKDRNDKRSELDPVNNTGDH